MAHRRGALSDTNLSDARSLALIAKSMPVASGVMSGLRPDLLSLGSARRELSSAALAWRIELGQQSARERSRFVAAKELYHVPLNDAYVDDGGAFWGAVSAFAGKDWLKRQVDESTRSSTVDTASAPYAKSQVNCTYPGAQDALSGRSLKQRCRPPGWMTPWVLKTCCGWSATFCGRRCGCDCVSAIRSRGSHHPRPMNGSTGFCS